MKILPILLALGLPAATAGFAAEDTASLWRSIREVGLDPARALAIHNLDIEMNPGRLRLRSGLLVPSTPLSGRTMELTFVGSGQFQIAPADDLERAQLELFTGSEALDVEVQEAVIAMGNARLADGLLGRAPAASPDPALIQQAEETFSTWVQGPERRGFGADAGILLSLLGDELYQHFFVVWLRSEELGDFFYTLDPGAFEQITLGQFVPLEVDDVDERQIRKAIRKARSRGEFRQTRFEDLGDWDTWVSTSLRNEQGRPFPGDLGFEPEHYELDVVLDPKELSVVGRARVRTRAELSGRTVASFRLHADLTVKRVADARGQPLPWFRSGSALYVVLGRPTATAETLTFVIEWEGRGFEEIEPGTWALEDTYAWYPRIGALGRATYDATLRWPKKHTLLASGRVVDSGEEQGQRWERRTLDVPAIAFSFEIGDFAVQRTKVGHIDVTIGFGKVSGPVDKGAREDIVKAVEGSLAFLERRFGAYPLDYMTIATVPREFSQGFLGFVTLSHYLLWELPGSYWVLNYVDAPEGYDERRRRARMETVAHELSHQWWGNKVGWYSYRDQWLSEALADFSALLYATDAAERKSVYLAHHASGWKASVERRTQSGRTLESLGPVVLGLRLNSSLSSNAYSAVVYDKGSLVFSMLSKLIGQDVFPEMLKSLADAVSNGIIDTASFLRALEKMSGQDLTAFAERFIYGTGMPTVYYTYEFSREDGKWIIEGEARQTAGGHYRYRLQQAEGGSWDVLRTRVPGLDVSKSSFVVPFQIATAGAEETTSAVPRSRTKTTTQVGLGGSMLLQGEVTRFRFPVDREPVDFWLDQRGEVLALFYSEKRNPKRMWLYQAIELADAARYDEALAMYDKALSSPLYGDTSEVRKSASEIERDTRLQNALIHLDVAKMYIDRGQDAPAAVALDHAEELLVRPDKHLYEATRAVLRSHLQIRAGDYALAYKELSKIAYLDFPNMDYESTAQVMRRRRFRDRTRVRLSGRGYAILALAAFATGDHEAVARQALKAAEERGADMQQLRALLPEES